MGGKKGSFRKSNTGCEKPRSAQKQKLGVRKVKSWGGLEWKLGAGIDVNRSLRATGRRGRSRKKGKNHSICNEGEKLAVDTATFVAF